jgi:hypothetical protein
MEIETIRAAQLFAEFLAAGAKHMRKACVRGERMTNETDDDIHICGDVTGTDTVHLHIVLAPLVAEGFCQLTQSTFGCGVCRDGDAALESKKRAKVYDLSSTERDHVPARSLREKPYRF